MDPANLTYSATKGKRFANRFVKPSKMVTSRLPVRLLWPLTT